MWSGVKLVLLDKVLSCSRHFFTIFTGLSGAPSMCISHLSKDLINTMVLCQVIETG